MMPLLVERDARFADLVAAMDTDTKSFQKIIETVFNYWVSPECDVSGIQSWKDYHGGVVSAFEGAMASAASGTDTAIFTSGGTIATIVGHVLKLTSDRVYEFMSRYSIARSRGLFSTHVSVPCRRSTTLGIYT